MIDIHEQKTFDINTEEKDIVLVNNTKHEIVKELNEKVNRFQLTYTNKDKQDCLAMSLLTYAVDLHKATLINTEDLSLSSRLTKMEELLDQLLEQ